MRHIHEIKQVSAVLFTVLLLLLVSAAAYAETGQAVGNFSENERVGGRSDGEALTGGEQKLIALSGGVSYSPDTGLYYRELEDSRFGISVPDGAVVTWSVRAELAPPLRGELYKDGSAMAAADLSNINQPGKYVLAVTGADAAETVRVSFTILTSPTCAVNEYRLPADFYVVSALLNGEKASYGQTRVDMSADGDYIINYRSPEADVDMLLAVSVDHTPPTAVLTGVTDGRANRPVTVSGLEKGVRVFLLRNGEPTPFTGTVSETGAYTMTLQDEAGNLTTYDFTVVTYAAGSPKALIGTAIVLVLALGAYFIFYRKYIRVG